LSSDEQDDADRRRSEFTTLYRQFLPTVRAHVRFWVRSDDVEEIVSATFMTAWTRFERLEAGAEKPWLLGIARNHMRNHLRSRRRGYSLTDWVSSELPTPEEIVLSAPEERDYAPLLRALESLSPTDQELLELSIWHELTPAEIATVIGASHGTVRVRLFRARRRFLDAVRHLAPEDDG
jgi:RNA polymerase sigma factor (sigma-70 family)